MSTDRGATCKYCGSIGLDWRQSQRTGRWYLAYRTGIPHSRQDCERSKKVRDESLARVREADAAAAAEAERMAQQRPEIEAMLASEEGLKLSPVIRRALARTAGITLEES